MKGYRLSKEAQDDLKEIIFYRLGKTEIEVARILHKRMDVTRYFDGL